MQQEDVTGVDVCQNDFSNIMQS